MKNLKKTHDIAGQSNDNVRKSQKHDANLRKNSSLYFQIGLILCLLGTYGLFEMKFEDKTYKEPDLAGLLPEDHTFDARNYIPEPDIPKVEPVKQVKKQVITNKFEIRDDDVVLEPIDIITKPQPTDIVIDPSIFTDEDEPVGETLPEIFNLRDLEMVPIYPGCEGMTNNKDRVQCMSDKLAQLIQRKFDTGLAAELGLSGVQRINVQFKIDKSGKITEVLTRAPHPRLEQEALRMTGKIPVMKPGLQQKKPVSVLYNLPIVFKVQD